MKNTMKTAAFGATLIAGVAGVNTVAHADTVEAPQATETASTVQSVHTTQADVDSAKQNVEQAKDNVKFVNDSLEQAKADEAKADTAIKNAQDNIKVSENADAIVKEQDQIIAKTTTEKAGVDDELVNAKADTAEAQGNVNNAKADRNEAKADVAEKEAEVAEKREAAQGVSDAEVRTNIANTENEIKQVKQTVAQKADEIQTVDNQISAKKSELENYTPETKTTTINPEERGAQPKASAGDYAYNKNRPAAMENVDFQGVREVEQEITQEQYDHYKKTGHFDYVVDNKALSEEFLSMLNELRHANGISGDITFNQAYLDYAEARANEMAKNDVLSHKTQLHNTVTDGDENAGAYYGWGEAIRVEGGKTILSMDEITTHKSLAYKMLLKWYSDFNNATGSNYGHRRLFLKKTGK